MRLPLVGVVALVVVFAGWIGTDAGGSTLVRFVDDLATAGAAVVATALCARASRRQTGQARAFWLLLAGACGAWASGELIWALYDLVLGSDVPVPSWADAAYLTAIPLAAAALLVHPATHGRALGRARSVLDALVLAAAVFFLGWTLVLEPLQRSSDLGSLRGAVTITYPLADIVIIFLVVLVIRGATSGDRLDLWFLLGGILLIMLSDASYCYLSNVQHYATGNSIDTGWFAGYLAIALGAHVSHSTERVPRPADGPAVLSSAAVIGPFVPLLAALSLAAVRAGLGHRLDRVALTAAFVLVGLFLVRQVLLALDLLSARKRTGAPVPSRLVAALGQAAPDDGRR